MEDRGKLRVSVTSVLVLLRERAARLGILFPGCKSSLLPVSVSASKRELLIRKRNSLLFVASRDDDGTDLRASDA